MSKYIALFLLLACSNIAISGEMSTQKYKTVGRPLKVDTNSKLQRYVRTKLEQEYCLPAVIAKEWNKKNKNIQISSSAIYKWTYRNNLVSYLPYKGKKPRKNNLYEKTVIPHHITTHRPDKIKQVKQINKQPVIEYPRIDSVPSGENESQALPFLIAALKRLTFRSV